MQTLSYVICSFAFIYSICNRFEFIPGTMVYVIGTPLSIAIGLFIKKEMMDFFKDFDWKPKNKIEKCQNIFIVTAGVGVYWYLLLLSIMVLFIPWFESYSLWNFKLYHIVFVGVAFIISFNKALKTL